MAAAKSRRGHNSSSVQKKHARFSEAHKDKKDRKYVATNAIFKSGSGRVRKRAKPSPKGKKSGLGKNRLTSRRDPSSSPAFRKRYTLADESNEVLNNYRSHVSDDSEQMIAGAYKDLVQRLDQTTLGPDALSTRIIQAIEAARTISTPIADTLLLVNVKDAGGNIIRQKQIPIGGTVTKFEEILQKKRDELETLWEEWEDVLQEIAETGAQILHDPKFPSQFGLKAVDGRSSPSSQTDSEVENLRRLVQKESENAKRELDQEAKDDVATHKKFQQSWVSWLQQDAA